MPHFQRKPVLIEAHQWFKNGDHPDDYTSDITDPRTGKVWTAKYQRANEWEGGVVRYYRDPDDPNDRECTLCGHTLHVHGWIDLPVNPVTVCPGDWIITNVNGQYFPMSSDNFGTMYEPVEATVPA